MRTNTTNPKMGNPFKEARTKHNQHGGANHFEAVETVAKNTLIPKSKINDLENDNKNRGVSYREIAKLAKYYGVSMDYLAGLTTIPNTDTEIRAICEYTGLSPSAVEALHFLSTYDVPGDEKIEHSLTVRFINRVLERALGSISNYKKDPDNHAPISTVFSYMELFVAPEDARIAIQEDQQRHESTGPFMTLLIGEDTWVGTIREIARTFLMERIREALDALRASNKEEK